MIQDVLVTPLKRIADERGAILHMLRSDDPHFQQFGEAYFSYVYPGAIKGWHFHRRMTQNYAVPCGMIKLVLYDGREDSPTKGELMEVFQGDWNYCLVTIPPGVWNGYKGVGSPFSIVANCATETHDPSEMDRKDPFDPSIPYDWARKDR